MATFNITGPDGKKYRVSGDNPEGAVQALKKHLDAEAGPWEKYRSPDNTTSEEGAAPVGPWTKYGKPGSKLDTDDRESPIPDALIETGKALVDGGKRSFEGDWMATEGAKIKAAREQAAVVDKEKAAQYGGSAFDAATEGSQAGVFGGYDDEIAAALLSPIDAAIDWAKGDGFDMGRAYTRKRDMLDDRKDARRAAYPGASLAGEAAGGVALGGTLAKSGITVAGKDLPIVGKTGAAALEGAGYGALYGSGEADPGERVSGGVTGGAFGAVTGVGMEAVGNVISKLIAKKSAPPAAAGQTSKEMKAASGNLFDASEASGVDFNDAAVEKLGKRLKLAVGRPNDKLRPKTAGYLDELDDLFKGKMSLEDFEEFRQVLGKEIKTASANDARTLTAMKRVMDDFADNAKSTDLSGDMNGIKLLRKARETWAQAKKTEIIENILDTADVKGSGKYTQSGVANAIRAEMDKLYDKIKSGKVKGFNDAEVALIRQMAKGGSSSKVVDALSKFAPRGPVSITLGQVVGSLFPGGNMVVPLAGAAAGAAKDRAALSAAERLRNGVATGTTKATQPVLPNYVRPFIGGGVAAEEGVRDRLSSR